MQFLFFKQFAQKLSISQNWKNIKNGNVNVHITDALWYNKCGDTTIVIGATHNEAQGGATANVTLNNPNGSNKIKNYKGASLPGTGGIGTTVFYLGGGAMVAVAGIYLISKKRMKNTQE